MAGIRYIGSKLRLAREIVNSAGVPRGGAFVDLFCGTGAVSEAAADAGFRVVASDQLRCAATVCGARLTAHPQVPFEALGGYHAAIAALMALPGQRGFITRQYSPASLEECGQERRYFTVRNARRIDAIRNQVATWSDAGLITALEERLLVADLLEAASGVANIAGTYGCFMKRWTRVGLDALQLRPRKLRKLSLPHSVRTADAFEVRCTTEDTAYLDPPYTKRQYASYYHVLETIAAHDEPAVEGVCGLRPWKHLASPFCYKRRALDALLRLVRGLSAGRVLISYSSEGHMAVPDMADGLAPLGKLQVHALKQVGRYRPNDTASHNGQQVVEYLLALDRNADACRSDKTDARPRAVSPGP